MTGRRRMFVAALSAEARAGWRVGGGAGAALGFFLAASAFVSMVLGADVGAARDAAPALIWTLAWVAALFAAHGAFDHDADVRAAALAADAPFVWLIAGKMAGRWLSTLVPLAAATPFAAFWLDVSPQATVMLALGALCAGPALAALGLASAAVASGLGASPALTGLLALPLTAPSLALGVHAAANPHSPWTALSLSLMLSAAAASACPALVAQLLRRAP